MLKVRIKKKNNRIRMFFFFYLLLFVRLNFEWMTIYFRFLKTQFPNFFFFFLSNRSAHNFRNLSLTIFYSIYKIIYRYYKFECTRCNVFIRFEYRTILIFVRFNNSVSFTDSSRTRFYDHNRFNGLKIEIDPYVSFQAYLPTCDGLIYLPMTF